VHGGVTERKQVKPRIIYVNEKYVLAMQKLSIFKPIFLELNTDSVSYFKEGISNAELNPLKIIDYREFFIELQKSDIIFDSDFSILLSHIYELVDAETELNIDSIKTLLREDGSFLTLNIDGFKEELRKKIKSSKALNKILLLEKLDKI